MSANSKIAWTDHTFNPWWGCVKIAPECTNCYAATSAHRYGFNIWGLTAGRRLFGQKHWNEPLRWDRAASQAGGRRRVFCASMADWLEDRPDLDVPRLRLLDLIHRIPQLDWLLLSKRLENFVPLLVRATTLRNARDAYSTAGVTLNAVELGLRWLGGEPPPNVWVGTTIGHADRIDEITNLRAVPAAVRFISAEPLLGRYGHSDGAPTFLVDSEIGPINALAGIEPGEVSEVGSPKIDWIILGGESGPRARPCDLDLIRALIGEARAAGTAVFVKQLGAKPMDLPPGSGGGDGVRKLLSLRDRAGADPAEWPADLRIRELPTTVTPPAPSAAPR